MRRRTDWRHKAHQEVAASARGWAASQCGAVLKHRPIGTLTATGQLHTNRQSSWTAPQEIAVACPHATEFLARGKQRGRGGRGRAGSASGALPEAPLEVVEAPALESEAEALEEGSFDGSGERRERISGDLVTVLDARDAFRQAMDVRCQDGVEGTVGVENPRVEHPDTGQVNCCAPSDPSLALKVSSFPLAPMASARPAVVSAPRSTYVLALEKTTLTSAIRADGWWPLMRSASILSVCNRLSARSGSHGRRAPLDERIRLGVA